MLLPIPEMSRAARSELPRGAALLSQAASTACCHVPAVGCCFDARRALSKHRSCATLPYSRTTPQTHTALPRAHQVHFQPLLRPTEKLLVVPALQVFL